MTGKLGVGEDSMTTMVMCARTPFFLTTVIRLIKVVIVMRICQVVATPPEVVGASTSAAVQSKSVETKNEVTSERAEFCRDF